MAMSSGVPMYMPTYLAQDPGMGEGGARAPPGASSPTAHPHGSAVTAFNIVGPSFSPVITGANPGAGSTYSVGPPQLQMWAMQSGAASIPLIHSPYPANYPPAQSPMMYMPLPTNTIAPQYQPQPQGFPGAPSIVPFSPGFTAPPAVAVSSSQTSSIPPECEMFYLSPNNVLPAGTPFCPRGVPPTEEYATGACEHRKYSIC